MTDLIDLLRDVSPPLKVGWILWCSSGLALGWFWLARETRVTAAQPAAVRQVAQTSSLQKEPWDLTHPPRVPPAAFSAVSKPSPEERDRPAKKTRRRRTTG